APVPAELVGKQARFGQLPEAVQVSIAKAYGSTQGVAALEADALVSFPTSGAVALVEGDTVYLKHVPQVRGAGPGEDLALTVRPTRQPGDDDMGAGDTTPTAPTASGAGTGTAGTAAAATGAATAAPSAPGTVVAGSPASAGAAAVGNLGAPTATSIPLVPLGGGLKSTAFDGLDGTYRWNTMPAPARDAIVAWLKNNPTDPAGAAFASRTGTGWVVRQDAAVTLAAGVVTFPSGLSLERRTVPAPAATPATAPASGGTPAPGAQPTQPPATTGGGIGVVAPGTAPPVPTAPDGHGHAH
ncbi:MAG: hypothetical protein JWM90_1582, partial [Thermoleophilia bacterium]|nr:hypothetical protein [Thermoleophilia bacterium]